MTMPNETTQTPPAPTEQAPAPAPAPATPEPAKPQVLNVEQIVQQRDAAQQELAALKQQLADKEKQMADEQNVQTTEALAAAQAERDAARAEVEQLKLEKELTGKVLDPDAAIKLMGSSYRKDDGSLDVDGFLEKHPYMRPAATPTAPNGGGGPQTGTGKDAQIQQVQEQLTAAEKAGNRVLAVSLQSKLTALRQS